MHFNCMNQLPISYHAHTHPTWMQKKKEISIPYTSKQMVTKYVAYQNPIKKWDNFKHEHKK